MAPRNRTADAETAAEPGIRRLGIPAGYLLVLGGLGGRALLQAGLTVLVARMLSRTDYGASIAVAGTASFFSVWAGLGASMLHLRDAATTPARWHASFVVHHRSIVRWQLPLIVLSVLVAWFVTSGSLDAWTLLLLSAGEMLGAPAADLLMRSFQGRARHLPMVVAMCLLPVLRLSMLSALLLSSAGFDLRHWAVIVFSSGLAVALLAFALAKWSRHRSAALSDSGTTRTSGAAFAVSAAANRTHADADKVILARMSSMGTAGEYSLAYRGIDILLLPVNSLIEWSARAMFLHGSAGTGHAVRALWARWVAVVALAGLASATAFVVAPLLPWIFGNQYEGATTIGRWLAWLPMTTACWASIRSVAATSGREKLVATVEGCGALLNIGLCVALVSVSDWRGAVLATYATHVAMACAVGWAIRPNRHAADHLQRPRSP